MGQILQELKVKTKKGADFPNAEDLLLFNRIKEAPCFNYEYSLDSNADHEYPPDVL